MPFPEGRRIAGAFAALVLALLATATASVPAHAVDAPPAVTGPADGAVVAGDAVAFTATDAGFELRWADADGVDAANRLSDVSGGGQVTVEGAGFALTDLPEGTWFWQVRALDVDAPWSDPRSFIVDPDADGLQLQTYPLEGATVPPGLFSGVDGRVWLGLAAAFSVALLAAVIPSAYRLRRTT